MGHNRATYHKIELLLDFGHIAVAQLYIGQTAFLRYFAGHFELLSGAVCKQKCGVGKHHGQREPRQSASGAEIENARTRRKLMEFRYGK